MQKNVEVIKSTQKNRVGVKETFKYISNSSSGGNGKGGSSKGKTSMTLNKLAEMFVEFREEVKTNINGIRIDINGIKTDIKNIHRVLKRNNLK
jgi:hypothetical protein